MPGAAMGRGEGLPRATDFCAPLRRFKIEPAEHFGGLAEARGGAANAAGAPESLIGMPRSGLRPTLECSTSTMPSRARSW